MRNAVAGTLSGAAVMLLASAASAQDTGTRVPQYEPARSRGAADQTEARRMLRAFADCTLERTPQRVQRAAAAHMMVDFTPLISSECLHNADMRFPGMLLRGELYGSLYRQRTRAAPVGFDEEPIDYATMGGGDKDRALREMGDCIVRADPTGAHALTTSRVGFSDERAAFDRVTAVVGPCVQEGQTLNFSRSMLSGIVMEALYHLSTQRALPAPGRN